METCQEGSCCKLYCVVCCAVGSGMQLGHCMVLVPLLAARVGSF